VWKDYDWVGAFITVGIIFVLFMALTSIPVISESGPAVVLTFAVVCVGVRVLVMKWRGGPPNAN
jgi:hypothetical protein